MIADIFAYAMLIALLLGLAAAGVERSLAELGLPRRFAWLGAYAVALAFPAAALWLAAGTAPPAAESFPAEYARGITSYANVDWDGALGLAWAASTLLMLVIYLGASLRLALIAKRWPRLESDAGPIAISDDVGPAVLGILDPRVVLPRWIINAPASARHVVMAHEREHIAARDPAAIVASQLIAILLPWNLPLWWFARRLRAAIEIDCDARAAHGRGPGALRRRSARGRPTPIVITAHGRHAHRTRHATRTEDTHHARETMPRVGATRSRCACSGARHRCLRDPGRAAGALHDPWQHFRAQRRPTGLILCGRNRRRLKRVVGGRAGRRRVESRCGHGAHN